MRITFILDTFGGGGKEKRCLQLIRGLNQVGISTIQVIVLKDDIKYVELFQTSSQIHIIDRKAKGIGILATARMIYKIVDEFNAEIIQSWGWISSLCCMIIHPFIKSRFIASYVADVIEYKANSLFFYINKGCCLMADRIVGNSLAGLKAYKIPKKKAVLIYNGIEEKQEMPVTEKIEKKRELDISTPFVVAMIASFWKTKDWDCYLHAAREIINVRQDVTFLAVGSGKDWERYNSQMEDNERALIKMLGRRDDVSELLQICNLTVLTSRYGEGLSNSILESMALGVPVIATGKGGTVEIIIHGVNGILLSQNDSDELASDIQLLLEDSHLLKKYSDEARKVVKEKFFLPAKTQEYIQLYKSLL